MVDIPKQEMIPQPHMINPSDPFDFMIPELVRDIISQLDAVDTEIMRRVSRL